MKFVKTEFFDTFECIGGDCPDTCCAGWNITIDHQTAAFYRDTTDEYGEVLRQGMVEADGMYRMKLQDRRCPHLNEKNLCEIYLRLGPEKMCKTCREYPRKVRQVGDLVLEHLSISCPEAARILLSHPEPLQFDIWEHEGLAAASSKEEDWDFFNICVNGMCTSVGILQNRAIPILSRLRVLVSFHDLLGGYLETGRDSQLLFQMFSDAQQVELLSHNFDHFETRCLPMVRVGLKLIQHRKDLDITGNLKQFSEAVQHCSTPAGEEEFLAFLKQMAQSPYAEYWEQYCVYYLALHYMEAYPAGRLQMTVENLIYLLVLHRFMAFGCYRKTGRMPELTDLIPIFTSLSRCFEHVSGNLEILHQECEKEHMNTTEFLLSIL